jgi:hypothetical protein
MFTVKLTNFKGNNINIGIGHYCNRNSIKPTLENITPKALQEMKINREEPGVYNGEERKHIACLELTTQTFAAITGSQNTGSNVRNYCSVVLCDV